MEFEKMKNQNNINPKTVILIFLVILTFLYFIPYNSQPTYTQSDVSTLMKFNASEFGCRSITEIYKEQDQLKIICHIKTHNPYMNEYGSVVVGWNETKIISHFPQFNGVKIELEPGRQECWNETIEKFEYLNVGIKDVIEIQCQTTPAVTKTLSGWVENEP